MISRNSDTKLEPKVESTERKSSVKAKKRRVVVVRPKIVVSKVTVQRPKKLADETKSKRSGSKIQRKRNKATSPRLVRRTKRGK